MNNTQAKSTKIVKPKAIIAVRKRKDASGTGLSHYILIEKPVVKKEAN
jgi:modified peptide precursor CbpA